MDALDKLAIKTAHRIVGAEKKRKGSQEPSTLATAQRILAAIRDSGSRRRLHINELGFRRLA